MMRYLCRLGKWPRPRHVGGKASGLHWLLRRSLGTPPAWACPWEAERAYREGHEDVLPAIRQQLQDTLVPNRAYAVRSSANVEDRPNHSFAGQFESVLGVRGVDAVAEAIVKVWESGRAPRPAAYRDTLRDALPIRMGVIIQEMANAEYAGVAFSRHPITGMDEIVVEGLEGGGERLLKQGITPERWIHKWGQWIEQPDNPVVPLAVMDEVITGTRNIARAYGRPVDLEWVHDGKAVRWIQIRPISGLDDLAIYSNRISSEFLPGIILPLVWSINVPLVNSAWIRLLTQIVGPNDLTPEKLARSFYYRAYFNMQPFGEIFARIGLPRESLELLLGLDVGGDDRPAFRPGPRILVLLPRMIAFAVSKVGYRRRVRKRLRTAEIELGPLDAADLQTLDAPALIERIERLLAYTQNTAYDNIVVPLMMQCFHLILRTALGRAGIDYEQLNLTADMPEMDALDPNVQIEALKSLYDALPTDARERIKTGGEFGAILQELPEAHALRRGIKAFMTRFGHLSDSGNDFSHVPWRERPEWVLAMIANHTPRGSSSAALPWTKLPLSRIQRAILTLPYALARHYRWLREAVSSRYIHSYGLLRPHLLALGNRLVQQDLIDVQEDIFYLNYDEVVEACRGSFDREALRSRIGQRRDEVDSARAHVPPRVIYGEQAPSLDRGAADRLRGTPTSRGHREGRARVVNGIHDWGKVKAGDIVIVPYSDISWTPLFARAAAIVAESGGILSHSSIVARELGIPAVVSVVGAMRIPDGSMIAVDGYTGDVEVRQKARDAAVANRESGSMRGGAR